MITAANPPVMPLGTFVVSPATPNIKCQIGIIGTLLQGNRRTLLALVGEHVTPQSPDLVLDFRHAGYVDSAGLGALVMISKTVRTAGGTITLAGVSDDLRRLLELTGLASLFVIDTMSAGGDR